MCKYMIIKINPLFGIQLNDTTLSLGMTKEDVITSLGEPFGVNGTEQLYYFENELRFDFNPDNKLEFIEFLGGFDGNLKPEIYGVSAFDIHADELIRILTRENNGTIIDNENGYSYAFPNIGIGIYRESIPEDIEEMVQEAKDEGEPMNDEDYKYELSKAIHWATIGLGEKSYYNSGE